MFYGHIIHGDWTPPNGPPYRTWKCPVPGCPKEFTLSQNHDPDCPRHKLRMELAPAAQAGGGKGKKNKKGKPKKR
jgi:hypothetical protein